MSTESASEKREADEIKGLREFAARPFWKLQIETEGPYPRISAYRVFKYLCGAQAMIYVGHGLDMDRPKIHTQTPLALPRSWEAGVCVKFAEGPQVSCAQRRLDPVRDWATDQEQILRAAGHLEKGQTQSNAKDAIRTIDRYRGWYLIAAVFDLDESKGQVAEQFIARLAPHLAAA